MDDQVMIVDMQKIIFLLIIDANGEITDRHELYVKDGDIEYVVPHPSIEGYYIASKKDIRLVKVKSYPEFESNFEVVFKLNNNNYSNNNKLTGWKNLNIYKPKDDINIWLAR